MKRKNIFLTILISAFILNSNVTQATTVLKLTKNNWKNEFKNRIVLVSLSLNYNISSSDSTIFIEAIKNLQEVYIYNFNVNSAYEMIQGKYYKSETVAPIKNKKALKTSKETDKRLKGYNKYIKIGSNTNNKNIQINNSLSWQQYNGSIPFDAVVGGYEPNGTKQYVCRANYTGGKHPGKLLNNKCHISYGGKEILIDDFEVLIDKKAKTRWTPWTGSVPLNAVEGGSENGKTLYICRGNYKGGKHIGKIVNGNCNIAYAGEEIIIENNFDVLIVSKNGQTTNSNNNTNIIGLKIGNKAPELNYKSPNGNNISLSSLKGKYVLIDFWASWCKPCRKENPNVVANYNKYKDASFKNGEGYTVYSISLDKSKTSWKNAIITDNLSWTNHVSDLKEWDCEAASIYKVNGIPMNFLIDGNGIIVAKNIRGSRLGMVLESLLK